jgi:hypothetical protein
MVRVRIFSAEIQVSLQLKDVSLDEATIPWRGLLIWDVESMENNKICSAGHDGV